MIKTESDYKEAKKRFSVESEQVEKLEVKLGSEGLSESQIKLAVSPLRSFALQLQDEIKEYENVKRGIFNTSNNLDKLGRTLTLFRIHKGITQNELAILLGVTAPQVSRDERNEYHGASIEKIQKVMKALEMNTITKVTADSIKVEETRV